MFERRTFESYDGTRLAYYVGGAARGPWLVLAAGLGGGVDAWSLVLRRFAPEMRILGWDYRGLYASDPAADGSYDIATHARDLACLLAHEGVEQPVLAGWSMGVQVALELHRTHAELPSALVALHGTAGRPLASAFDSNTAARVLPHALDLLGRHWRWLMRPTPAMAASRDVANGFMRLCRRAGIMGAAADPDAFHDMARGWVALDLGIYSEIFTRLGEHDASDLLARVSCPTLVLSGACDRFIPPHRSEALARALPNAELVVVPGATHFGLIEYPSLIAARIERFLRERVWLDPAWGSGAPGQSTEPPVVSPVESLPGSSSPA